MTESLCCNEQLVTAILGQISLAIDDIALWNESIAAVDDYYSTAEGGKTLAATSMLLEAIGEGVKRIDRLTDGKLLPLRPEIPWADVMCMRNHIAHGYFDIDADLILDTVQNDLATLKSAVEALISHIQG